MFCGLSVIEDVTDQDEVIVAGRRRPEYIGPGGLTHTRGRPAQVKIPPRALDQDTSRHLWESSAELTGVRFDALAQLRQA